MLIDKRSFEDWKKSKPISHLLAKWKKGPQGDKHSRTLVYLPRINLSKWAKLKNTSSAQLRLLKFHFKVNKNVVNLVHFLCSRRVRNSSIYCSPCQIMHDNEREGLLNENPRPDSRIKKIQSGKVARCFCFFTTPIVGGQRLDLAVLTSRRQKS